MAPSELAKQANELGPWALFLLMLGVYLVDRFWGKAGKRLDSALATLQEALSTLRLSIEKSTGNTAELKATLLAPDKDGLTLSTRVFEMHQVLVATDRGFRRSAMEIELGKMTSRLVEALERQGELLNTHLEGQATVDARHVEAMEKLLPILAEAQRARRYGPSVSEKE